MAILTFTQSLLLCEDISIIPLWDGETVDCRIFDENRLTNRFGGGTVNGVRLVISHTSSTVHTGQGGFQLDADIPASSFGFSGISLTGYFSNEESPDDEYVDTRDLSRFEGIAVWLKNETGVAFNFALELKDFRDSNDHRARANFSIQTGDSWDQKAALLPPTPANGWIVEGTPDFSRSKLITFIIESKDQAAVAGSVFVDDLALKEPGDVLDSETAPIVEVLERLAERQFYGLWGSRDRRTGLVPLDSDSADVMALNSSAGLVKVLPRAISESWVARGDSDVHIAQVLGSLDTAMNALAATYGGGAGALPPRYLDRVSLAASHRKEESPADAAFMFLALHQYKSLPGTPAGLRSDIESLLNRFNFAAFSSPQGWKLAYELDSAGFTAGAYDGYSTEIYAISLAAHLASSNHVDITTHYHSGVNRVATYLVEPARAHLTHSMPEFRAPFLQWLFPLFVDTAGRGRDTYPDLPLAGNPHHNAVLYQMEAHDRLAALGRATLQRDASDDGTGRVYEQFSCYNDFGQPELLMPWSAGFSFLADPATGEAAIRTILSRRLHGPLGLQDSARWFTGEAGPVSFPARIDFWNVALSEMALLQYLYDDNRFFTALPEVTAALDLVFRGTTLTIRRTGSDFDISFLSEEGAIDPKQ